MKTTIAFIFLLLFQAAALGQTAWIKSKDRVVKVFSSVENSTQVRISWAEENHATAFRVYRKLFSDTSWTTISPPLSGTTTHWIDTVPSVGVRYEYRVVKNGSANTPGGVLTYNAYGFTAAGIGIAPEHSR